MLGALQQGERLEQNPSATILLNMDSSANGGWISVELRLVATKDHLPSHGCFVVHQAEMQHSYPDGIYMGKYQNLNDT